MNDEKTHSNSTDQVVVLAKKDFIEMKRALAVAQQMRNRQLSNIEGRQEAYDIRCKWKNEFDKWFDLDNRTNSVGKPVIIKDPDGSWTNADIELNDETVIVRPDRRRPFADD